MQKFVNKSLSALLILTLLFSMSMVAFAATVPATYNCTVAKSTTNNDLMQVSELPQLHTKGTANEISYYVSKQVYIFDVSVFPNDYKTALREAYALEGFVESLTIEAQSGSKTVNASLPNGTYTVVVNYCNGDGAWSVAPEGEASIHSGTIEAAPISYSVELYRIA